MSDELPPMLFVGPLHREFVIGPRGDAYFDQPGGSALYAAVGARLWSDESLALVSRVGEDFPRAWLEEVESFGIDCQGVHAVPGAFSTRSFAEYREDGHVNEHEPRAACARHGLPLPKELLSYVHPGEGEEILDRYPPLAVRAEDLSARHRHARAVFLAPGHLATHATLPAMLRAGGATIIALSPSPRYLPSTALGRIAPLITGIQLLIMSERHARSLFRDLTRDLAEMARRLAAFGWPLVIIHSESGGGVLYQAEGRAATTFPSYPGEIRNPAGTLGAFAGGFLAGWRRAFDPIEAALYGSVSASLSAEGPGALFALRRIKGLAEARLEWLRGAVSTH